MAKISNPPDGTISALASTSFFPVVDTAQSFNWAPNADVAAFLNSGILTAGVAFAATTTTTTLGFKKIYACTSTAAARTLTISSVDIAKGSAANPWKFVVKDESGGAGTNNITIATEGAQTIDGAASIAITADYGSASLYSNGTNLFSCGG